MHPDPEMTCPVHGLCRLDNGDDGQLGPVHNLLPCLRCITQLCCQRPHIQGKGVIIDTVLVIAIKGEIPGNPGCAVCQQVDIPPLVFPAQALMQGLGGRKDAGHHGGQGDAELRLHNLLLQADLFALEALVGDVELGIFRDRGLGDLTARQQKSGKEESANESINESIRV